jgi:hypothetical protein
MSSDTDQRNVAGCILNWLGNLNGNSGLDVTTGRVDSPPSSPCNMHSPEGCIVFPADAASVAVGHESS